MGASLRSRSRPPFRTALALRQSEPGHKVLELRIVAEGIIDRIGDNSVRTRILLPLTQRFTRWANVCRRSAALLAVQELLYPFVGVLYVAANREGGPEDVSGGNWTNELLMSDGG